MKLRTLSETDQDAEGAARWYEAEQTGLGDQFLADLADAYSRIEAAPESHPLWELTHCKRESRFCMLKRFSYYVVFEIHAEEIVAKAVSHASRLPYFWQKRDTGS